MKKRQISFLSASLIVLVAPAELVGDVGVVGVVGDVGDPGLLWEGFLEGCGTFTGSTGGDTVTAEGCLSC